jgi:hypothetical protein
VHVLDRNARFELPFAVDSEEATLHHTYLDTSGRPVLVLHKKNVVAEHNQHFLVTYNFSKTSMLLEPLILVISYFVVFLFAMLYVRFDLSISKVSIRIPDSHLCLILLTPRSCAYTLLYFTRKRSSPPRKTSSDPPPRSRRGSLSLSLFPVYTTQATPLSHIKTLDSLFCHLRPNLSSTLRQPIDVFIPLPLIRHLVLTHPTLDVNKPQNGKAHHLKSPLQVSVSVRPERT